MHPSHRPAQRQQQRMRDHVEKADSLTMFNLLTGPHLLERIEGALPPHRERLYPPTVTLAMFVAQALSADGSCQQAVDCAAVKRLVLGLDPGNTDTGGYCKARRRLPLELVSTLAREAGEVVGRETPKTWQWRGRPVRLVDGATVSLADTAPNQATYPQPESQGEGLGFPQVRLVGLFCLGCAALLDASTGPCKGKGSDEQTLLREILAAVQCGDILVGDALFATYFLLCELQRGGVDAVFEQQGARRRSTDFALGQALGVRDHLVVLAKPKTKPEWMSQEEYDQAPQSLAVREFAAGGKIMVSTFLDPKDTPKAVLKALYARRWHVELDLRNIKTTLGMQYLRCKTPEMVLKELWVYLLAYNIIRLLMAQSALLADQIPRQLSFKHTVQIWLAWQQAGGDPDDGASLRGLLVLIAQPRVGLRPGRIEPRALKRRPKPFSLLTEPRPLAQERVRQHGHPKKQR